MISDSDSTRDSTRIEIDVPDETAAALKRLADRRGVTVNDLLTAILVAWLESIDYESGKFGP